MRQTPDREILGPVDIGQRGKKGDREIHRVGALQGIVENRAGSPRDRVEEFGDGLPESDQVVASVPCRSEDDFASIERIKSLPKNGEVEARSVGTNDDGPLEAFASSDGEGSLHSVAEVCSLLWSAWEGSQIDLRQVLGFAVGQSDLDIRLMSERVSLFDRPSEHSPLQLGGAEGSDGGDEPSFGVAWSRIASKDPKLIFHRIASSPAGGANHESIFPTFSTWGIGCVSIRNGFAWLFPQNTLVAEEYERV